MPLTIKNIVALTKAMQIHKFSHYPTDQKDANMVSDEERYRSFAERYVIERASTFRKDHEQEDAFKAYQDALSIFRNISEVAKQKFQVQVQQESGTEQEPGPARPVRPTLI